MTTKTTRTTKKATKLTREISGKVDANAYINEFGYPEVGVFIDKADIQKFYKQLDSTQLEEWIGIEGITYSPAEDSEAITRMRMCMAILYLHFPKTPSKPKSKAKYTQTLEELVTLCLENDVAVEPTDDTRIFRMRMIMALRPLGIIDQK